MTRKRVFVGMSGGVDSSVAALRLLRAGYDVVGVFIKVWQPDFIRCDWEKERLDAMRVAAHLSIPFLTFDAALAYKKGVADYMIRSYEMGLTPNPDVMCNEHVKFGVFYDWARENGADYVATGHYARIEEYGGAWHLLTAHDTKKDQSYFLARLRPDILPNVLFPIGDTLKEDVRKEAEKAELPTAVKKDSQGLCFLGHVDIPSFLSHFMTLVPGNVVDEAGKVVGHHKDARVYTLGQRHGFTVNTTGVETPVYYVVEKHLENNELVVSVTPPVQEKEGTVTLWELNSFKEPVEEKLDAVFRYHGPRVPVHYAKHTDGSATLSLMTPTEVPTPGQVCVLYHENECVLSGIIV